MEDITSPDQPAPPPWHSKYPAPKSTAQEASREHVLSWLSDKEKSRRVLLVDLRRNDHEGGTIRGSLNLPAQSFFGSQSTLYMLAVSAGVERVVFYCGSSRGRGPRAAGWFQDYIKERGKDGERLVSYVLEGGVKGWAKAGEGYTATMDGYNRTVWENMEA